MGLTFCCIGGAVLDDDAATLISVCLITRSLLLYIVPGGSSVLSSRGLGRGVLSSCSSASVFSMYSSSFLLLALGGFH